MLCQKCHKNIATVHFTQIINNEITHIDLCRQCAMHQNWMNIKLPIEVSSFLGGFIKFPSEQSIQPKEISEQCEKCAMTFNEFLKTGKMGCDNCYVQFGTGITPLLKRMHRNISHTGKVPEKLYKDIMTGKEIDLLEKELQNAVKKEEYEKAAVLRDKIKAIRSSNNAGKGDAKDGDQG